MCQIQLQPLFQQQLANLSLKKKKKKKRGEVEETISQGTKIQVPHFKRSGLANQLKRSLSAGCNIRPSQNLAKKEAGTVIFTAFTRKRNSSGHKEYSTQPHHEERITAPRNEISPVGPGLPVPPIVFYWRKCPTNLHTHMRHLLTTGHGGKCHHGEACRPVHNFWAFYTDTLTRVTPDTVSHINRREQALRI